jgi:hypothetical protein
MNLRSLETKNFSFQMNERIPYYQKRLHLLQNRLTATNRDLNRISLGRFFSFAVIVMFLLFQSRIESTLLIPGLLVLAAGFGLLVKRYMQVSDQKKFLQKLIDIHNREIEILSYRFEQQNAGSEFANPQHRYSGDLDLFGEGSLYQFMNRTVIKKGSDKLAGWLTNPLLEKDLLLKRQLAIKELAEKDNFRQDFMATGELFMDNTDDLQNVRGWLYEPPVLGKSWFYRSARIVFPVIFLACVILTLISPGFYRLLILVFLVQLLIVGLQLRHTNRVHGLLSRHLQTFKKLSRLLGLFEKETFQAHFLAGLKRQFCSADTSAARSINQLSRLLSTFDTRLNILAGLLLNGILLWDIQCILRLEKWKVRYRSFFGPWVEGLAEFDALNSLATFHFNFPDFCFPGFLTGEIIRATAVGHPLIAEEQRVCNDFALPSAGVVVIITGANMAGKSTFLRTVGINLVLAMAGAPVCAKQFAFDPAELYTSMRTSDSLRHRESYFYAELKRIKTIVDELSNGKKMMILLDELLKGTNSTDKHKGSVAILDRILALNGTGIIATHDLELAQTEYQYPGKVINKCFEIEIKEAEVFFDYRLQDGITRKMNASLLMRQMGIVK